MIREHITRVILSTSCTVDSINALHQSIQTLLRVADQAHADFLKRTAEADRIADTIQPHIRDENLSPGTRQALISAVDFLRNFKNL